MERAVIRLKANIIGIFGILAGLGLFIATTFWYKGGDLWPNLGILGESSLLSGEVWGSLWGFVTELDVAMWAFLIARLNLS